MSETMQHVRNRIGAGLGAGFYPAPHRYQLYLSPGCPRSLRVSITLDLLGLRDTVVVTTTPSGPDAVPSLHAAYETTWHHYTGPVIAPALCDRWSGRIVSNHTPDILRDLATRFGDPYATGCVPRLRPPALAADIDAFRDFLDEAVTHARTPETLSTALGLLDRRLASAPYALGDELTAADVDLWVALVNLDLDLDLARTHEHLRAYVVRLRTDPAFRR
jgi:putative glutathione S-transferase